MYTIKSESDYNKWRQITIKTCYALAVIVLISETTLFFLSNPADLQYYSITHHLIRFLVAPSAMNFLTVFIGNLLIKKSRYDQRMKNVLVCLILYFECFFTQIFHCNINALMLAALVAIYMTIIFGDLSITRLIFALSVIGVTIMFILGAFELSVNLRSFNIYKHLVEYLVAMVIYGCSYITAKTIIDYETERERKLSDGYKKQLDLVNQSMLDSKTGLFNRRTFIEKVDVSFSKCQYTKNLVLAILEVDDLGKKREAYGRELCDQILLDISQIIKECFASNACTCGKYDFDQFAVLVRTDSQDDVLQRIEKVNMRVSLLKYEKLEESFVTVSFALSSYTNDMWSSSDMFTRAIRVLEAKRTKRQIESFKI